MLYIGHFSFDETNLTGLARHGYFTMAVSGETAEDAVAAFKAAIKAHKGENPAFDTITAVYIEDIVEIPSVSANPIMTRLQSSAGEFPESVSHSLPGVKQEGVKAYGFAIDVMQIRTQPTHSYKEMTPFIRF